MWWCAWVRMYMHARLWVCVQCTVYGAVLVSVYTFCLAFFIKLKIWFTFCSSTIFELNTQSMNKRIFFTIHFYQSHSWYMHNNLVYFIFQFHFFLLQCKNLHESSVFVYHFFSPSNRASFDFIRLCYGLLLSNFYF